MQSIHYVGNWQVALVDVPRPEPKPGEVLVQIAVSAICGSEMHSLESGVDPAVAHMRNAGHEIVGVVADANQACQVVNGQRVGVNIMKGCGHCVYCLVGDYVHCLDLHYAMDGHSDYIAVPEACLIPLPDDVDWDAAILLSADTLGTPYHALKHLGGVNASETAAIFGFGPIGIGSLTWVKYYGLRAIVSEISPYRRELALTLGADYVLDPTKEDVVARVRELTGGGAEVCLDCSPSPRTLNDALDAARVYGRVGFIAEKHSATINPSDQVIRKELTMAGGWYFKNAEVYEQVEHYRRGLRIDGIITHRFTLDQAPKAYAKFRAGETGKVIFYHPDVV